ncbi:histidine kinase [Agrococcus sp. ARC_14]|uniref:sensor histidine kinase n=1 Tax=Agrococcus sp. ARC_14 TaxID=2919927 RepID=UPI001F0581FF|nr:histidine kinase [Agrococcus sp. ARC_14]MCH1882174.1 histidine kinase [Agrococcus sp. ARC_14]
MTLTRLTGLAATWWPALIAVIVLLANTITWRFTGPLDLIALVAICGVLSISVAFPRIAFAAGAAATLLAAGSHPSIGVFMLYGALGIACIITWCIGPLRTRALLGIPVGALAAIALATQTTVQEATGYGGLTNNEGLLAWVLCMLVWAAALGIRALADALRAEQARETAVARTTVVESELRDERLRADLTHDFHDVMAHSLAVLAAQAEGLRLSHHAHPERIDPVLTTISDTARLALVEVRQLLERVDDDARRPQPTSADIPGLVAQMRSTGPTVTMLDVGAHGHLSRLGDIAAYRIVQESLTNALRHGGSDSDILVSLTWTGPGLTFVVSSPIPDRAALKPAGRGIAGMHERARLAGGTVEIDADGDRFVVSAHLPYEPVSDAPTAPLTEEQLFTLPVPRQQRPEDVVAPWIVEATRLHRLRHPEQAQHQSGQHPTKPLPENWSEATAVDLTPAPLPDGRIPNPAGPNAAPRPTDGRPLGPERA